MIADYIFIAVAIIGTLACTITDLKGRWAPDWINFFMIVFGLSGHALISVTQWSIWPIAYSAAAAGILYGVSYLLFYTGTWGGGDAKLFVGLGALLPVYQPAVSAPWPWLLTLWINMLIFACIFGIAGSLYLAARHKEKFLAEFKAMTGKNKLVSYGSVALFVFPALVYILKMPISLLLLSFLLVLLPVFYFVLKSVENSCMFRHVAPHKLVEGDWVAEDIAVGNYNYKPAKSGIEKKEITKLIELEKSGKLKQIKVKDGLPHIPSMLAGLLVSIFYGDLMFAIAMGFLI